MDKIYYHLPGIFEHFNFYELFIKIYKEDREKFYDWAEIGSIYGSPQGVIWNGGRMTANKPNNEDQVALFCKENQINVGLTFSNCLLEEKHLYDTHGNALLEKFNWGHNRIIVNSDLLTQYILQNYPKYKLVSSTTKCLIDRDQVEKELNLDIYDTVVLDYNFNNNINYISSLKNKEKCEFLVNPVCYVNCPRRQAHYIQISKDSLWCPEMVLFDCDAQTKLFYQAMKSPAFIGLEAIKNIYVPMGFKNFKIEGRTTAVDDLIEILIYYMVKPEYQIEIREKLYYGK